MINRLEKLFSQYGYSLRDIGVFGFGLKRTAALELVDILRDEHIAILGGDVYKIKGGKPEHTYDTWFLDKNDDIDDDLYIENSLDKAETFIKNYDEPKDGTILYKLEIRD